MAPLAFLFRHSVVLDAVMAEGVDWDSTINSVSAVATAAVTEVETVVVGSVVLVAVLVAVLLLVDVSLTLAKPTVSTGSGKMC